MADALSREVALLEMKGKIESAAEQEMTDAQRQYYLRQQLKAIQDELGEGEKTGGAGASQAARRREAARDGRGRRQPRSRTARAHDAGLARVPDDPDLHRLGARRALVGDDTEDRLDPVAAREVLDQDHYDLDKVKERIVEYLAVQKLKSRRRGCDPACIKGPILCFVGPPGVGKTSLGQSIARAMNRKFVRISLGGVRDEAEIRGHRRTYIGAHSRAHRAGAEAGRRDEPGVHARRNRQDQRAAIQGDPAAALLEVLDPAQNHAFRDHYLEINVDLSRVLFIATANQLGTIHPALSTAWKSSRWPATAKRRSCTSRRRYLIPRQLDEHGLTPGRSDRRTRRCARIIAQYTREAGVRSAGAADRRAWPARSPRASPPARSRRAGRAVVERRPTCPTTSGPPRFHDEVAFRVSRPGVATGVAWTETGGDVLFIEASLLPSGHHNIILTGQLGNVMQESARAAVSHIRRAREGTRRLGRFPRQPRPARPRARRRDSERRSVGGRDDGDGDSVGAQESGRSGKTSR